jgi:hypothetical protein
MACATIPIVRALLFRATLVALAMIASRAGLRADEPPAPAAYAQALTVMAALAQAPFVNFTTSISAAGAGVALSTDDHLAALAVGFGKGFAPSASWRVSMRSADGKAVIQDAAGATYVTRSQLFKPTWEGAYQWTRYGFGHPPIATPPPDAAASPASGDDAQAVIGRTLAIAPGAYRIEDGAPLACPDTKPGRHLHLTALVSPQTHPLTDVVIEDENGRICSMRFNLARGNAFSLTGTFELDFADRGGYWVVVDGAAHVLLRAFGIGAKHASMTLDYANFTFPTESPDPQLASIQL